MKRALLLALAALVALIPFRLGASGATFVAASANPGASFATASDFNTVAVALADPGTPLRGTVSLATTAASDRGLTNVRFQTAPAGTSTWTDVCTDTTAPYTCAFDTTTVADGLRDVRALALDAAGYTRTSVISSRRVDNSAPATTLTDPGTPLTGTKTFSATASDTGSGVATTVLQYRASTGSAWITLCAAASCSFDTSALADGLYDLRSLVTDRAGNTGTSMVASRRVDNTAPSIAVDAPPTAVRGETTLTVTASDGSGTGIASVRYQVRPASTGTWIDACSATTAPFSCPADTTVAPDGLYDARAVATDGAGLSTTSAIVSARIDNTDPSSATLAGPGSPLSGTVTLTATAADAGSGVASVRFERASAGGSSWTTICSDTAAPYACAWDTTAVADGLYDLRVVATDAAGNTLTSSTVANRRVDAAGPTVTLTDPGTPLRSSVTLAATATDPAGVASVTIQRKPASGSTWTTICTDTGAPYTCAWNTTGVADGAYDLRATAVDTLGRSTTSATVSARAVDNTAPTGTGVQAVNGTGTAGRIDAGDVVTFTYSEALAPASILAGWTGAATTVSVRINEAGTADTLSVYNAANTTRLALTSSSSDLQLRADRTTGGARFTATMTMTGTQVALTFGALASGSTKTATATTPMIWTPSSSATDLAGNAVSGSAVVESGTADRDF